MQFKKFQNMSQVAVGGGGGGLKTSDEVWSFRLFFNPSLTCNQHYGENADSSLGCNDKYCSVQYYTDMYCTGVTYLPILHPYYHVNWSQNFNFVNKKLFFGHLILRPPTPNQHHILTQQ